MNNILLIGVDSGTRNTILESLGQSYQTDKADTYARGLVLFKQKRYEFIFFDIEALPSYTGKSPLAGCKNALRPFWKVFPSAYLIALASKERIRQAVLTVKAGADDYLTYPVVASELHLVMNRIEEGFRQEAELAYLRSRFWQSDAQDMVATSSSVMEMVFENIRSVAPTRATVLLTGETGVGKGVLARLIHRHGPRPKGPFIAVHCGAIPETLLESELFGHERGAFTGAVKRKLGRFELANDGTIFLDEIGTISATAQIKLLQVLQENNFQRVGGEQVIETHLRVIAATNEDLKQLTEECRFRKDLYYRLNVFPIEIPPLRERIEDIPHFVHLFIKRLNHTHLKDIHGVQDGVVQALQAYSWPGNIRELENLVERAYILETSPMLSLESFPVEISEAHRGTAVVPLDVSLPIAEARARVVNNFERQYLKDLLTEKKGKIGLTATAAGIGVRQLHKLMTRHGMVKEDFKGR